MAWGPWQAASLLQRSQAVAPFDFEDAAPKELSSEDWARLLLEGSGLLQNSTAAAVEGVKANKHGDLIIFLSSLATNLGTVIVVLTLLGLLRWAVPRVYGEGKSYFGWISASWSRSTDEVEEAAGLDHAMHLEFLDLSMRICLLVGLPCVLVLCPLHFFFGGGAAGQDRLSSIGMGNVVHGSWLCWVHAFMVWYVALVVHAQVHRAQKSFLPLRMRWLKEMPEPQVTSVLLQNIPEHLKTEEDLRSFFDDGVFGYRAVKEIYFGKDTRELLRWQKTAEDSAQGRAYQTGTGRVLKGDELKLVADSMTQRLRREILRSDDMNQSCAFVTFQRRREAAICYRLLSADDNDGLRADLPPEPSEVLWQDLCVSPERQAIFELLGYFLIFLVFWGFMPLVVFIQSIANLSTLENDIPFFKYLIEQLPALATLWNGLMASFALSVAMSMLPTLLMLIFTNCFVSKAEVNRQHRLQIWYNYFLVTYVLLVTAVGSSIFTTGRHLLQHPFDAPGLLAQNMPQSTHFYLNFIPMQMAAYATGGLRLPHASKYLAFRSCYDSEKAKEKCEPEDQDFMGMGSRSARAALQLSVVLTFCTLSPLISLLGWLCFVVCRTVHGFLFVEVEQRKADLGGVFWVTSLEQVQQGLFLFVLLMTGVLAERSGGVGPSAVAAGCWVFVAWSYVSFKRRHRWQHLEVEEILQEEERPQSRHSTSEHYGQPELPRSKSLVQAVRSKLGVC